ncbi:MAG: hypothetical protein ACFCVH_12825 [Alphaproteobacteria bacterium]
MVTAEAVRQAERELMSKRNVTGVGIGERDGKAVITVFVTRKVPVADLDPGDVVPRSVAGYATQVVEVGEISTEW